MKICPNCDADGMVAYDNALTRCPVCGGELIPDPYENPRGPWEREEEEESSERFIDIPGLLDNDSAEEQRPQEVFSRGTRERRQAAQGTGSRGLNRGAREEVQEEVQENRPQPAQRRAAAEPAAPRFHWREHGKEYYRGSVVELTPVIRYASRGTKLMQALFMGVPYQMGHSTTFLKIRIEEHVPDMTRFPERNLTVEYQSDAEGELTYGDDITIETVTRQEKFVAKRIWVNENNGRRLLGKGFEVSAAMVRVAVITAILTVISLVVGICNAIYDFFHSQMFSELMVWIIIILGILYAIKSAIGPRRRW